jgi:hypothetical protein
MVGYQCGIYLIKSSSCPDQSRVDIHSGDSAHKPTAVHGGSERCVSVHPPAEIVRGQHPEHHVRRRRLPASAHHQPV